MIEELDPEARYTRKAIDQIADDLADRHGRVEISADDTWWELEFEAYGFTFRLRLRKAEEK